MTLQPQLTIADATREGIFDAEIFSRPNQTGPTFGTLDFGNDEDYYFFSPDQRRDYSITVDSAFDTSIGIYDYQTFELDAADDDSGEGANPRVIFGTGNAPQVILIQVDFAVGPEPEDPFETRLPADYTLFITDLGPNGDLPPVGTDIIGNGPSTAAEIAPGTTIVEQSEDPDDFDYYAIYLEAGQRYRFTVANAGGNDPLNGGLAPILELREVVDGQDTLIQISDSINSAEELTDLEASITYTALRSGLFFLATYDPDLGQGNPNAAPGIYQISAVELGRGTALATGDPIGDTAVTAAFAEVDIPFESLVDTPDDLDVFEYNFLGGNTYTIDVVGDADLNLGVALLDANGNELFFDPGGVLGDVLFNFEVAKDQSGPFFIEVGGDGASVGAYELIVTTANSFIASTLDAQKIALLYEAGLNRDPDFSGLNFWIDRFEGDIGQAATLRQISQAFIESPEFLATVGDVNELTDLELVTGLYENVLDREADEPGLEFWLSVAQTPGVTSADLLIGFACSPENADNNPEVSTIERLPDGNWDLMTDTLI
ncbi:MAG: DUF4214 domain-containing protein [Paracoccaceae bacterium]